jgi:hypothetical protein
MIMMYKKTLVIVLNYSQEIWGSTIFGLPAI